LVRVVPNSSFLFPSSQQKVATSFPSGGGLVDFAFPFFFLTGRASPPFFSVAALSQEGCKKSFPAPPFVDRSVDAPPSCLPTDQIFF